MKLSAELIDEYCGLLNDFISVEHAAKSVGVHRNTVYLWRKKAETMLEIAGDDAPDPKTKYEELCLLFMIKEAEALSRVESAMLQSIIQATQPSPKKDDHYRPQWQAAAWFLERRFPEMYGRFGIRLRELDDINPEALPVQTPERREEARRVVKDFLEKNKK